MDFAHAEQANRIMCQAHNRLLQIMRTAGVTRALEQISAELLGAVSEWEGRRITVSNPGYVIPATEATR